MQPEDTVRHLKNKSLQCGTVIGFTPSGRVKVKWVPKHNPRLAEEIIAYYRIDLLDTVDRFMKIEAACYAEEVEPLSAPNPTLMNRAHYSTFLLDIYALHDIPCDQGCIDHLRDQAKKGLLSLVHTLADEQSYYTDLVQDEYSNLYAVRV